MKDSGQGRESEEMNSIRASRKVQMFLQTIESYRGVVCCCRCGSSRVKQPLLTELRCLDCDNSVSWDALSFTVVEFPERERLIIAEVSEAFSLRERTPPWVEVEEVDSAQGGVDGSRVDTRPDTNA